ncbi:L-methionine/branched-chain amino acid transporter [Marinomonas piezotolerans]|uniref:L-methionine/branched-chain amino acid transporter n=1 Tax=Marinomonas piezotolerans TaxID=2213058 RepID=A0A370U4D6_9GAMM|nr:L-methionine/branched-chain amino acid transporter [Marinomonas piezotolerans]RDL42654.1 L-methionine/branched-chain amino acid transporter [Marinomonas piezotolerans]
MQYQRTLGPFQGMAMTITTFIGTGLMILPAISVSQAGSFAFYAWLITALVIIPIAFVFALLGSKFPSASGASHYIGRVLGAKAERAVGWLFLSIMLVGPAVAIKVAAAYLAIVFELPADQVFNLSLITLIGMLLFSVAGLKNSANFQTAVVICLIGTVIALLYFSFTQDQPFESSIISLPMQYSDIETTLLAAGTIFWCFIGIEVMAHMGAEFKNPSRDFPIALLGGISIVVTLYLATVLMIIQYNVYGDDVTNSQSLALLVGVLLGDEARRYFALGAYLIAFSNVGVYILGFSRMVQAMAAQRALPHYFATLSKYGTPLRAVGFVGVISLMSLLFAEYADTPMSWFIEMTNGAFLLIYLLTCITAIKSLNSSLRWLSVLATVSCIVMATFMGKSLLFACISFAIALLWEYMKSQKHHIAHDEIHVQ